MTTAVPEVDEREPVEVVGYLAHPLANMLEVALTFAYPQRDADFSRIKLTGVFMHAHERGPDAGKLTIVACDGFSLIQLSTDIDVPEGFEPRIYAPDGLRQAIKFIRTYKPRQDGSVFATIEGDELVITPERSSIQRVQLQRLEGEYPSYEQLIPPLPFTHGSGRFALPGRRLEDVGRVATRHGNTGTVRIYPGGDETQPIRMDWTGNGFDAVTVLMPSMLNWGE